MKSIIIRVSKVFSTTPASFGEASKYAFRLESNINKTNCSLFLLENGVIPEIDSNEYFYLVKTLKEYFFDLFKRIDPQVNFKDGISYKCVFSDTCLVKNNTCPSEYSRGTKHEIILSMSAEECLFIFNHIPKGYS